METGMRLLRGIGMERGVGWRVNIFGVLDII